MLKTIHRMQRNERGFTLVELLIVIAIIAILAAIALPQFTQYRKKAANAKCAGEIKSCMAKAAAAYADNGSTTAPTCDASGGSSYTVSISNEGVVSLASATCSGGGSCTFTNNTVVCE